MRVSAEPKVVRVAHDFKAALLRAERAEQYVMAERYLRVESALADRIAALAEHVAGLRAGGREPSLGMLYRLERWQSLEQQMLTELASFNGWAAERIAARQRALGRSGFEYARETLHASGLAVPFDALPTGVIEAMVGYAGDGSPLSALLVKAYPDVHGAVADALVRGVALGQNPARVASQMRDALGVGLDRAFLIARTEELRAFRTASQETYREAGVTHYRRMATLDDRTCIGCLAADGEISESDEVFDAHPGCRCSMAPLLGDVVDRWRSSEDWFNAQDSETQEKIMGPGRLEAYESGLASWSDMFMRTDDATWGGAIVPTPLSDLVPGGMPGAKAA